MYTRHFLSHLLILAVVLTTISHAFAHETGSYPFGSYDSRGIDSINVGNLNVHFEIPIFAKAGRGIPFSYTLSYDGLIWTPVGVSGSQTWQPDANWGWRGKTEAAIGYVSYKTAPAQCWISRNPPEWYYGTTYRSYAYHDLYGGVHTFDYSVDACGDSTGSGQAKDTSGYAFDGRVHTRNGGVINAPFTTDGSGTNTDSNGNEISADGSGNFTDTLGVPQALSITGQGTASSPRVFTYKTIGGALASVTVYYANYNVQTNWRQAGVTGEYHADGVSLVSQIVLADGNSYTFGYEPTDCTGISCSPSAVTGRISSITLPTGGIVSYAYTGGPYGITVDGTPAALARTTSDGAYTYTRFKDGSGRWVTDVTNSANSEKTEVTFWVPTNDDHYYEVRRVISDPAKTYQTVDTCYDNAAWSAASGCASPAAGVSTITQRTTYTTLDGSVSSNDAYFDLTGLVTKVDDYDYGSGVRGNLLRRIALTYGQAGIPKPTVVSIYNGSDLVNALSTTIYNYDEGTPSSTSGIPQHVAATGPRGNVTHITRSDHTTPIETSLTYDDTGALLTMKDGRGNTTSYTYDSATHAFVTSVNLPDTNSPTLAHHSSSAGYDTSAGVMTSSTRESLNKPCFQGSE
jgi:YD repeat-containing protein